MSDAPVSGALEAHDRTRQLRTPVLWDLAPFCLVVDWLAAAIIAVEIVAGVQFHG